MTIFQIPDDEVELTAVRSQGPGGQNVNKVASAIQLRFDIRASSLPLDLKERLLAMRDHRISQSGVVVIKSQEHRSQDMNRIEEGAGKTDGMLQRISAAVEEQSSALQEIDVNVANLSWYWL